MHFYAPIMRKQSQAVPLLNPNTNPKHSNTSSQSKSKRDQPVDAEELSRRLSAHIASQEPSTAPRRHRSSRRTRPFSTSGAPEPPDQNQTQSYHHIPVQAALSFARTATPNPRRIVHRLSVPVLREHLQARADAAAYAGSVQRARELDLARMERQARSERNAFQWGKEMEGIVERDEIRGVYSLPRRAFGGAESKDGEGEGEGERAVPVEGFEGRGDWAQREEGGRGKGVVRDLVRALGLGKGRDGGKRNAQKAVDDGAPALEKFVSAESEGKRSRRTSLLARLKWHPGHGA